VLVAYRLDGGEISDAHGGPVRLYVAPMYGYKSLKWLDRIEVTDPNQVFVRGGGVPTKGGRLAAAAREVDVSLESVQSGGKPLLGLTSFTKSGSKSVTYLGTHARLFRSEQTLTREILVTDVHETLHRALGYGVGQERWIDDLAYWSLGW